MMGIDNLTKMLPRVIEVTEETATALTEISTQLAVLIDLQEKQLQLMRDQAPIERAGLNDSHP